MKKLKKLLQGLLKRDKYAAFRGTVFLVLIFAIPIIIGSIQMNKHDEYTSKQKAGDAALQIVQQLRQTIDADIAQLSGNAYVLSNLDNNDTQNAKRVLQSLTYSNSFSQAYIVTADADNAKAADYKYNGESARVVVCENGALDIRLQIDDGRWLMGVTEPDLIEAFINYNGYKGAQATLYDRSSGEVLYRPTQFSEDNYTDAMTVLAQEDRTAGELGVADQAQTMVKMANGQRYYIAQNTMGLDDWGLLIEIPDALLADGELAERNRNLMPIYVLAGVLLLLVSVGMLVFYFCYLRRADHLLGDETAMLGEMLAMASRSGDVCLLTYDHNKDALSIHQDSEAAAHSLFQGRSFKTLDEMLAALMLDEEEAARVRKTCADLRPGRKVDVQLHRSFGQQEQHLLMTIAIAGAHQPQTLLAIHDNTEEIETKLLAAEEKKFRAAMQAKCASIWQINLDRDCWKATYALRDSMVSEIGIHKSGWRSYSADLAGALRDYVEESDYNECIGVLTPPELYERYRRGERTVQCEYRGRVGQNGSEWRHLLLHMFRDPDSGELLANMYVTNVDAEKNAENERMQQSRTLASTLMAIGGVFYALFYVDLDEDRCYTAKIPNNELVTQLCAPYKQMFDRYINDVVHPEDREHVRRVVSAYNLRKDMHEGCHYLYSEFRRKRGEGYEWAAIIVQAARFENGTVRDVALAFRRLERENDTSGQKDAPERALA